MLIWNASPHAGGATDALVRACANAARCEIIYLRSHVIAPCAGCGRCRNGVCRNEDDAALLFSRLQKARANIFAAPIYFYALPAHFKAFIDRAQIFWHNPPPAAGTCAAALLIGATSGARLFEGATLTLAYFLRLFGIELIETAGLRNIESPADLKADDLGLAAALAAKMAAL